MILDSFSFNGTVGRRAFLVRLGLIGLSVFALLLVLVIVDRVLNGVLWAERRPSYLYEIAETAVLFAGSFVPFMWAAYALIAKRLRSIGLNPAIFILLSVAVDIYEGGVFQPAFLHLKPFGFYGLLASRVFDLLFFLVLFLWPQRRSLDRRAAVEAAFA